MKIVFGIARKLSLGIAFLAIGMALPAGCGRGSASSTRVEGVSQSPADRFRESQKDTVTPHGRIVPSSVRDRDGKIDYDTTDGSKWTIDPPTRAGGTTKYDPPQRRN